MSETTSSPEGEGAPGPGTESPPGPSAPGDPRRVSLSRTFSIRRKEGRAVLVPFLTAGYPRPDRASEALDALVRAGADVVELGIPFSDPLADGPTIQRASFRALEEGMTVAGTLDLLRAFRARHDTPIVLFTYLNPVLRYGFPRFVDDAREAGAQGLLLTDLPAGADPEKEDAVREAGLDLIRLVAPTTPPERVPAVVEGASGFVYYVSRTGVTGARTELRRALAGEVEALRAHVELPIAVGFGISTPAQAALVAKVADGVVVGSALIDALDRGGVAEAEAFLAGLRKEIDEV
ncbi:MAG TPA: tryptophan synthase subunit alpha [Longimicrobiales bacterium]|nr:tryptophan synthase subunit alpha [Longimicrobiales bacterium]